VIDNCNNEIRNGGVERDAGGNEKHLIKFAWPNLASVYRILTKLGTKMRSDSIFLCSKFQSNHITPYRFMVTFIPRRKKEKNKETKPVFESLYLENAYRDLIEIWNVRY